MRIMLSPAKTMTGTTQIKVPGSTIPRFMDEASEIALHMTQFPANELARILKISPRLAAECYHRYQEFHSEDIASIPAILAYVGVVFKNMNPGDFTKEDFLYAQEHLCFTSGCYGLLRPLDLIKPYRMEFDVKLPELGEGNMYPFWRDRLTDPLIADIKKNGNTLVYLASMDIQPYFHWKKVQQSVRVIMPEFKIWKNGKEKTIVIYAKMCRGQMSRYIIKNRITDPEELKAFRWEGFSYNERLSKEDNWVFTQE